MKEERKSRKEVSAEILEKFKTAYKDLLAASPDGKNITGEKFGQILAEGRGDNYQKLRRVKRAYEQYVATGGDRLQLIKNVPFFNEIIEAHLSLCYLP